MADAKSTSRTQRRCVHVRKHVWRRGERYRIVVKAGGVNHTKSFPLSTDAAVIDQWIQATKTEAAASRVKSKLANLPKPVPVCPRDENTGFCYIYFIAAADQVKIGRALDPWERMENLQIGSPHRLQLLAAVPAHASLEPVLHRRFANSRTGGEWFHLNHEMRSFIDAVAVQKMNPVELLWDFVVAPRQPAMRLGEFARRRARERAAISRE